MSENMWAPIGFMRTCFKTKNGTPRQATISPDSRGILTVEKSIFTNPEHSLEGLEQYSYVWILFLFHLNQNKGIKAKVKPPRLDGGKLGVFATRSPHRPNSIGLTLAKLEKVETASVTLSGLDIVDGTPILDIKPYIPQYDTPQVVHEKLISSAVVSNNAVLDTDSSLPKTTTKNLNGQEAALWKPDLLPQLDIVFTSRAESDLIALDTGGVLELFPSSDALKKSIIDVLKADPRSTYRRNKCSDRLYYFNLDKCHITAWFDYSTNPVTVEVLRIKPEDFIAANRAISLSSK